MGLLRKLLIVFILLLIDPQAVYSQVSEINKTTGWYMTNECFQGQVDVNQTPYTGAELDLTLFSGFTNSSEYYGGFFQGYYLYCDLDNDGFNNFVRLMYKSPWPNEDRGIIVHSRRGLTTDDYTIRYGLTEPRKEVVTDFNNDGTKEVLLFSQGMDTDPFPGDSIMLYHIDGDSVQYFDNVSFYHSGTVGDIDNDGDQDILTGFSYNDNNNFFRVPEVYINEGDFNFRFDNSMFINFPENLNSWFTIELYDLNDDGYLDLLFEYFTNEGPTLNIVYSSDGVYDYESRDIIDVSPYDTQGFIGDIDFYDLNNDSQTDIILSFGYEKYQSLVYLRDEQDYVDATSTYIEPSSIDDVWVLWNFLKDIDDDGDIDIIPDGSQHRFFYLENNNGVFQKVDSTPITSSNSNDGDGNGDDGDDDSGSAPSTPTIVSPTQNADSVAIPTEFIWQADENATSYQAELFTDALNTIVFEQSLTDTSIMYTEMVADKDYLFRVRAVNTAGTSNWSNVEFKTAEQDVNTSISNSTIPTSYSLNQNYPNPFNPTTSITYSLPQSAVVSLKIYDITGKYITTLVDGVTSAGIHTVTFDAGSLSSGMYVYTLETDGFRQSRQMMLVK